MEKKSEHPLARAINERAEADGITAGEVEDFAALPGNGLSAIYEGSELCGGNFTFISSVASVSGEIRKTADQLAEAGKTPLYFSRDGKLLGMMSSRKTVRVP